MMRRNGESSWKWLGQWLQFRSASPEPAKSIIATNRNEECPVYSCLLRPTTDNVGMCSTLRKTIHEEVQLVESFTRSYRAKLGGMIDRMNRSPAGTLPSNAAWQSIRWCVEAVDLMLSSQAQFAKVMNEIAEGTRGEA